LICGYRNNPRQFEGFGAYLGHAVQPNGGGRGIDRVYDVIQRYS